MQKPENTKTRVFETNGAKFIKHLNGDSASKAMSLQHSLHSPIIEFPNGDVLAFAYCPVDGKDYLVYDDKVWKIVYEPEMYGGPWIGLQLAFMEGCNWPVDGCTIHINGASIYLKSSSSGSEVWRYSSDGAERLK